MGSIEWSRDGRSMLVTATDTLEEPVFRIDARSGKVTRLTREGHFANVRALPKGGAIATMNSVMAPDDVFRIDGRGRTTQLTNVNGALLAELDPVTLDKFSFTGANNDRVWGMKIKPVRNATLPIAFVVHGGPQASFGNGWSYRWNPRVFFGAWLWRGHRRFPRLGRLRPGLHRRDPEQLGRLAARGPPEGPRLRDRQ